MNRVSSDPPQNPYSGPGPGAGRLGRAWPILRWVVGLVTAAVAFDVLFGRRTELSTALSSLEHLRIPWVVIAVVAELASIGAYAAMTRGLLKAGGVDIGLGPLTGITLAANAIQNSLPAGPAWSTIYAYRQFRQRGADAVLVGWTLVISLLVAFGALAAIALGGLVVSESQAAQLDLVGTILAMAVIMLALVVAVRRGQVNLPGRRAVVSAVRLAQRLTRHPHGAADVVVDEAFRRLRVVRLTKGTLGGAAAWALTNWGLDLLALAVAFGAVGAKVPWRGLLLAYGAGQLAANLPITLGGLGVVEGSLTLALVFYGGAEASTVAAVLLYRLVSFWFMLVVGWLAALAIRMRTRSVERGIR